MRLTLRTKLLLSAAPLAAFILELLYGMFCWWVYKGGKALLAVIILFNAANLSLLSPAVPGPESLLVGLRREIAFDQMEQSEYEGHKVWVIRGRWKKRDHLTGPNQPPLPPTAPIPPYVPSLVDVTIDQETGWPYRAHMTGRAPSVVSAARSSSRRAPTTS